jgi:stearoyl-CoA desaturase (delta-9 desaturase)
MAEPASAATCKVILLGPKALRRERSLIAVSVGLPVLGTVLAPLMLPYAPLNLQLVLLLACLYSISVLGITVGYHRLFAHRSFETTGFVRFAFAVAGSLAVQGPVSYWVAAHRRHHQHADDDGDPHSPHRAGTGIKGRLVGLWYAHLGWVFARDRANPAHYARDIYSDSVVFQTVRYYFALQLANVGVPALAGFAVTGTLRGALAGFLWVGLVRIFLAQNAGYVVNSICHMMGSRPFSTTSQATNNLWLVLPTFGESLHNTHHAFPHTANNRLASWWELDLSWVLIRTLERVHLAWDVCVPSPAEINAKRVHAP